MRRVRDFPSGGIRIFVELELRRVACRRCGAVKRERLDFLADNPRYTRRFAFYVGRQLRLLRAHGVIQKISKTHRYKLTPKGELLTAALFAVRQATLSQLIGTAA